VDGQAQYVDYHQARMQWTYARLGITQTTPDIMAALQDMPPLGQYRARITYTHQIELVEYYPLQTRTFRTFALFDATDIEYTCKFADRSALNQAFEARGQADEVLLVKSGYITDASIANVAFFHDEQWWTPRTPLLQGTTRARLLHEGVLQLADIHVQQLAHFEKMALCNAVLGFHVLDTFEVIENSVLANYA
jgi:4-amino-4-deoxychorismate lyase